MIVGRTLTAETFGAFVADLLRDDETVEELWVTRDSEGFIISILTRDIDHQHELALYRHGSAIQHRFPDTLFEMHVIVARDYPSLQWNELRREVLPPDARRVQPKQ